jgi:hypothetical protein
VVEAREAVAVELQWRQLREMKMRKGRQWGAVIFRGREEEEVRRFHSVEGGRHNEERRDGRGG